MRKPLAFRRRAEPGLGSSLGFEASAVLVMVSLDKNFCVPEAARCRWRHRQPMRSTGRSTISGLSRNQKPSTLVEGHSYYDLGKIPITTPRFAVCRRGAVSRDIN